MRSFLFLVICCIAVQNQLLAQPGLVWPTGTPGKDFNVTDASKKRQGAWIRVHAENPKSLYYRGQFKDGVPVGEWEWYYSSGQLMTKMTHVKGDEITDNVNYFPNGKSVMSEGRFVKKNVNGKEKRCREGVWKIYDEAGTLRAEEQYTDSILNGFCKYYFDNGKVLSEYRCINGLKEGPFVEYYDNGKKHREGTYLRDNYEGQLTLWHENGTKQAEGKYLKGLQDGSWTYYKTNGMIEMVVLYKNGRETKRAYVEGTHMEYYDDGIPKCEYTWENSLRNGPFIEWYDLGKFEMVPADKTDAELGITHREKLVGQVIQREGDYIDGKLEGEIKSYDTTGKLIKIEVYQDGKLVETKKP